MSRADMAVGAVEDPATGCLYWARPEVRRIETSGRAARVGSLVHLFCEMYLKGESAKQDDVDPMILAEALALFTDHLKAWLEPWRGGYVEVGLRYDSEQDMSEVGPRRGEPAYEDHGPAVLKGTLDLARIEAGVAWIADIKTGQKANTHPEQLYAQAVAFSRLPIARTMGVTKVNVGFAFVRKTKAPDPQWEELDADRLDHEAGRIRKALRMLPVSEPQRGDWCWRCSARTGCPAWQYEGAAE
jgi:hypothetical protein